jgi:hypothetical protein
LGPQSEKQSERLAKCLGGKSLEEEKIEISLDLKHFGPGRFWLSD